MEICDSTKAEVFTLLMGFQELRDMMRSKRCVLEGVSTVVVD